MDGQTAPPLMLNRYIAKEEPMELVEIPKHFYNILISDTALDVARFGYKNPSYFEWDEREISRETGDEI